MAVATTNAFSGPFTANGVTTIFPFTFTVLSGADVTVALRDADGVETTVSANDYSVSLTGDGPSAGSVTFDVAPATGNTVWLYLDPAFTQETEFVDGHPFIAGAVNDANDRAALRDQVLRRDVDRALLVPIGESGVALPPEDQRAGKYMAFDGAGAVVMSSGTGADAGLRTDLAASAGSDLMGFLQSGTGATARTVQAKMRDTVSVKDFGAVGDGVTDDTAAIQAAMAAHDVVHFPAGTFKITAALALTRAGQALIGAGSRRTEIKIYSTTLAAITLANGVANYTVQGVKVTRSGVAVSGANGVHFLGTTDNSEISDVWCEGHWNGLVIGTCDTGLIHSLRCNKNLAYGVYQTNSASYGPSQWEVNDALVDRNGVDGWRVESTAGPAGLILGTIHSIKSFANTGRGLHVIGNATTPVFDVRIVNAFLGSDNAGSIRLNTYGGKHRISGFFERNGRDATGPTLGTAATNTAPGIEITANNIDVTIYGSTIDDNSYDGIQHDGGVLIVSGCNIFNNGQALTGGRRNGILSQGGRLVVGSSALTNLSGNTTQLFGVATSHDDLVISGNDMAGNTSGGATLGGTADAVMIANAPKTLVGYLPATTDALVFNAAYTPTATGGNKGAGTINVATDIYKNNTAYTNP